MLHMEKFHLESRDELSVSDLEQTRSRRACVDNSFDSNLFPMMWSTSRSGRRKANSTTSLFVGSTMLHPSVESVILSLSMIIQFQMLDDHSSYSFQKQSKFSVMSQINFTEDFAEEKDFMLKNIPQVPEVYHFIKNVCGGKDMPSQYLIIAMIYITNLITAAGLIVHWGNWRIVFLVSILITYKIWDDSSHEISRISQLIHIFSSHCIAQLERVVLESLQYNVIISPRLFARYYFELRDFFKKQSNLAFSTQPLLNRNRMPKMNSQFFSCFDDPFQHSGRTRSKSLPLVLKDTTS